ncbi:MAG: HAMP domain-containing histidine kinase [Planctomycetes bacterium]|nr:HAMP domain-containing histidine kinase [Planctomycetota bacterium]
MALAVLAFVLGGCLGALLARKSRSAPSEPAEALPPRDEETSPRTALQLAGLVHELRTPLAAIRAYAELLAGASSDRAFLEEASGILVEEAERLDALIGRHLDRVKGPSSVEAAERPARLEVRCDLGTEARAACELLRPLAARRGFSLELDESAPPVAARGEATLVRQILANLLGNAVKHAVGGTRIALRWGASEAAAWIEVEDDGPGVREPIGAALFEPFARGTSANATAGHGLGLWVARELARACGGELELAPRSGGERGACFRLSLANATADEARATVGSA